MSENYIDSEEDVLYQKDASFSAELDIALVPAKELVSTTARSKDVDVTFDDVITTTPSFTYFQTQSVNYDRENTNDMEEDEREDVSNVSERSNKNFDSNTIPYYHEFTSKNTQKHGNQGTPLYIRNGKNKESVEHVTDKNTRQSDDRGDVLLSPMLEITNFEIGVVERGKENLKLYKSVKGFDGMEESSLSSKGIINTIADTTSDGVENMKNEEDDRIIVTTTLGPSLEQKVRSR